MFDVFGYPLAQYHYGTCDQVLQESMAAGIVPVVLDNYMEKSMVKNKVTGMIAKNEESYVEAVEKLYVDKNLRKRLSRNAREYAIKKFSIDKMIKEWEIIFKELLVVQKTEKKWDINKKNISAKDVFLESLGEHGKIFSLYCRAKSNKEKDKYTRKIRMLAQSPVWQSETKSTAHHYHNYFKKDKYISKWSKIMKL